MQAQFNGLSFTEFEAEAQRPEMRRLPEHLEWFLLLNCHASATGLGRKCVSHQDLADGKAR